jgi:hypothetical protein
MFLNMRSLGFTLGTAARRLAAYVAGRLLRFALSTDAREELLASLTTRLRR